jgi:predicted PhzF superfamily epimerase YddE/YHI9
VPPARFTISQGIEMGRPSLIKVEVPDTDGGIRISGTAVSLDPPGG